MKKTPKLSPKKKPATRKKKVVKKPRSIVMVSPVDPALRFVVASEFADDQLIERELMGDVLPTFIYQYCANKPACKAEDVKSGKCEHEKVAGLSTKGVNEVVRRLNRNPKSGSKIRINPMHLLKEEVEREGEKGIEVSVFGEDLISMGSAWGVKFEPYFKVGRDNKRYANTFAVEKALSKAERNAKRKLISEGIAVKMIQVLIAEGKGLHVQALNAPAYLPTVVRPAVPVASTPEALYKVVEDAIKNAKTIGIIIDLDERAQASDKLDAEMKKKLHSLALGKTDILQIDG